MRILMPSSEIRLDLCADCGVIYIASSRHAVVRYIVLDRGYREELPVPAFDTLGGTHARAERHVRTMSKNSKRIPQRPKAYHYAARRDRGRERETAGIMGYNNGAYMSQCGSKVAYKSERSALAMARECEKERGGHLRVYACPICGNYHITHKDDARCASSKYRTVGWKLGE